MSGGPALLRTARTWFPCCPYSWRTVLLSRYHNISTAKCRVIFRRFQPLRQRVRGSYVRGDFQAADNSGFGCPRVVGLRRADALPLTRHHTFARWYLQRTRQADESMKRGKSSMPPSKRKLLLDLFPRQRAPRHRKPFSNLVHGFQTNSKHGLPYFLWDIEGKRTVQYQELESRPAYTIVSHTWGRWRIHDQPGAKIDGSGCPLGRPAQYLL